MHFSIDFNLYTFTAINYSHYYNSFADSNPIESLNPRAIWRNIKHRNYCLIKLHNFLNSAWFLQYSVLAKSCWIINSITLWIVPFYIHLYPHLPTLLIWSIARHRCSAEQMEMTLKSETRLKNLLQSELTYSPLVSSAVILLNGIQLT